MKKKKITLITLVFLIVVVIGVAFSWYSWKKFGHYPQGWQDLDVGDSYQLVIKTMPFLKRSPKDSDNRCYWGVTRFNTGLLIISWSIDAHFKEDKTLEYLGAHSRHKLFGFRFRTRDLIKGGNKAKPTPIPEEWIIEEY